MASMAKTQQDRDIRALLADDDAAVRRQLSHALETLWPALRIVEACDGVDAWDAFLEHEPALCFLDVRMPGLTGIEVAQRIADRSRIVFLTAADDRAFPALQDGGAMHLIKPLEPNSIGASIAQVQSALAPNQRASVPSLQHLLDQLAGQLRRRAPLEVIEALDGTHPQSFAVDEIIYVEAEIRGTRVVSTTGEALVRIPLKQLAAQLDPTRFQQVNRFAVVNQQQIASTRRIDERTMLRVAAAGRQDTHGVAPLPAPVPGAQRRQRDLKQRGRRPAEPYEGVRPPGRVRPRRGATAWLDNRRPGFDPRSDDA